MTGPPRQRRLARQGGNVSLGGRHPVEDLAEVLLPARLAPFLGRCQRAVELARRVLSQDSYDIESLRVIVFEVRRVL